MAHIKSIIPQRGGVSPIDNSTVFYAPFDEHAKDILKGVQPIGNQTTLLLNGASTYVEIPNLNSLSSGCITAMFWIKPTEFTSHTSFISKRPTTSSGFIIFMLSGSNLTIDYGGAGNRWSTGYVPPLNTWTHVAYTHDGTNAHLYVNGSLHSSSTLGNATNVITTCPIRIGADTTSTQYFYKGRMEDVVIFDQALPEVQIKEHISETLVSIEPAGHWKLNEGIGGISYDRSQNGNDGIITDATWAEGRAVYALIKDGYPGGVIQPQEATENIWFPHTAQGGTLSDYNNGQKSFKFTFDTSYTLAHFNHDSNPIQVESGAHTLSFRARCITGEIISVAPYINNVGDGSTAGTYKDVGSDWVYFSQTKTLITGPYQRVSFIAQTSGKSGAVLEIEHMQFEKKPYATEFTPDKRSERKSYGGGVLIEEGTTNLCPNLGGNNYNLDSIYGSDRSQTSIVNLNGSNWIEFDGIDTSLRISSISVAPNTTYTWSFIIDSKIDFDLRTTHWDNTSYATSQQFIKAGKQKVVKTFTTQSSSTYEILHIYLPTGTKTYLADFQLEQKTYATSFVNGIREGSSFRYPITLGEEGTISLWVKLTPLIKNQLQTLIDGAGTGSNGFYLAKNADGVFFFQGLVTGGHALNGTTIVESLKWYHVVATWNSTGKKIFVNGVKEGESLTATSLTQRDYIEVGHQNIHATRFLNGIIDELRIDKVVRTDAEIQAWYYQGRNGW